MQTEPQGAVAAQPLSIWSERRFIAISFFIALAQFQYGYDTAAVSGFQSMPGFLVVFGYEDVSKKSASLCDAAVLEF